MDDGFVPVVDLRTHCFFTTVMTKTKAPSPTPASRKRRRGLFLVDVAVGMVLVLVAAVLLTQAVFQLAEHRRLLRQRQVAVETLQNVAECLEGQDAVTEENEALAALVAASLPEGRLRLETLPSEDAPGLALLRITLSYDEGKTRPRRELSLVRIFPAAPSVPSEVSP